MGQLQPYLNCFPNADTCFPCIPWTISSHLKPYNWLFVLVCVYNELRLIFTPDRYLNCLPCNRGLIYELSVCKLLCCYLHHQCLVSSLSSHFNLSRMATGSRHDMWWGRERKELKRNNQGLWRINGNGNRRRRRWKKNTPPESVSVNLCPALLAGDIVMAHSGRVGTAPARCSTADKTSIHPARSWSVRRSLPNYGEVSLNSRNGFMASACLVSGGLCGWMLVLLKLCAFWCEASQNVVQRHRAQ